MKTIIENYAHDFRDMSMSEVVLETMLRKMLSEILTFEIKKEAKFGDTEIFDYLENELAKITLSPAIKGEITN